MLVAAMRSAVVHGLFDDGLGALTDKCHRSFHTYAAPEIYTCEVRQHGVWATWNADVENDTHRALDSEWLGMQCIVARF